MKRPWASGRAALLLAWFLAVTSGTVRAASLEGSHETGTNGDSLPQVPDVPDVGQWMEDVWYLKHSLPDNSKASLDDLYKQIHAYVRDRLKASFPGDKGLKRFGKIPANLLGNGDGRDFSALKDSMLPFQASSRSGTKMSFDQKEAVDTSENLLKSLGFPALSATTRDTLMQLGTNCSSTPDQDRQCQCTVTRDGLAETFAMATEAEYMGQFSNLKSHEWRDQAAPGFYKGVGGGIGLILDSPKYLDKLLGDKAKGEEPMEQEIDQLMAKALGEVTSMPYLVALGERRLTPDKSLWSLREKFQGVKKAPGGTGGDLTPSDAGDSEEPFPVRTFLSTVLKYQIFEELCLKAGQFDPIQPGALLHQCDFSRGGSKAGDSLRTMMGLGRSRPWPEAVETLTEGRQQGLDGGSLLRYYAPLYLFLQNKNRKDDACIGWGADCQEVAREWINVVYDPELKTFTYESNLADWAYNTNINDENAAAQEVEAEKMANFKRKAWNDHISQYEYDNFTDESLKRRFQFNGVLGTSALPEEKFKKYSAIMTKMTGVYAAGKICPYEKQDCDLEKEGLTLEPGIEEIIENPLKHSFDKLLYAWEAWRDATGKVIRDQFLQYVDLSNEAAKENGFKDNTEMWLFNFAIDDPEFKADMEEIWGHLSPLYKKVHAYTRHMLRERFGHNLVGKNDPIPAHIMGNMWAQDWTNLLALVQPFNNTSSQVDVVNEALESKTVLDMFHLSDSFYVGLGLDNTSVCYRTDCGLENTPENKECIRHHPMIQKPDWDVLCHASAWDMFDQHDKDFRIKMCTDLKYSYLITIHHEMGHIQYYSQYKHLPIAFRQGANEAFHEAIGDTMALAVQTPDHLASVGLLTHTDSTAEDDINFLFKAALEKIVFLPYGYLLDKFRWDLFDGTANVKDMNYHYWKLREEIQGVVPSVNRSEADFDAGAKFHVTKGDSYIRYFGARILQFQFYRQMCLSADQYDPDPSAKKPLHLCDFSKGDMSFEAGQKMKQMLMKGSSMPWPEILEEMTGKRKMDASALVEYFAPLDKWLTEYIETNNVPVGWDSVIDKYFPDRQK